MALSGVAEHRYGTKGRHRLDGSERHAFREDVGSVDVTRGVGRIAMCCRLSGWNYFRMVCP